MEILEELLVLDLSQIMAGPLCSMILGDMGAKIIKVEPPEGDVSRHMGDTFLHEQSDYFLSLNRNKRSIVIDLKQGEGKEIFYQLVKKADLVLENFRPGTAEKLGVDYATLSQLNPNLIYCSISGFGQNGPYKDRPAMDPIIQALGGIMGITGDSQVGPLKVGAPISDFIASLLATIGILGALYVREKTGRGQKIEISMLDGIIFSLIPREQYYFIRKKTLPLLGNQHYQIAPCNTFQTKDGAHKMVIVHSEKHWQNFCQGLGLMDLAEDERFKTNSDRLKNLPLLNEILEKIFAEKTQQEWVDCLSKKGIMVAPVYNLEEVFQDPQVGHDEMVTELDHPVAGKFKILRTPIELSETPLRIKSPPPLLGQHTKEILFELGYSPEVVEQLNWKGIVK
ncbi:MAG: CaiB/BaiF CoA transferase family protein [Thermodesulfobacteriota bacterium]